MEKFARTCSFGLLLGTLCIVSPPAFTAQPTGCTSLDLKAALQPSDGGYADAAELKQLLRAHGVVVGCVLRSKMTGMFEGQEGAALYRTDQGDLEALFLPRPGSWDALEVVRREKNGWYLTSFKGRPNPWPANLIEGSQREYYVKHTNVLCVTRDERLARKINRILSSD